MYGGVVQQHFGEYRTGLFFERYPDLPLTQKGMRFKYKSADSRRAFEDVITNLAEEDKTRTIITTYALAWRAEAYVLLGKDVYRIIDIAETEKDEIVGTVCKTCRKEFSISLRKVDNATGVEI